MDRLMIFILFAISLESCFLQEQDKACNDGDFCEYKCQCNKPCQDDLKCPDNDTCKPGWFGYRCQYQDLAVFKATLSTNPLGMNISWLTDQNDYTCNTANDLKSVTVTWPELKAIPLTWTRVTVNEPQALTNVELQFTKEGTIEKSSCLNETFAEVNNKTLDRRCNDDVTITSLTLSGNLSSLCSFYISGDRNIAYKQNASQSSSLRYREIDIGNDRNAYLAVDGDTKSSYIKGSCSHTYEETSPNWNLTLQNDYFIKRLILYNRADCCPERLQGFIISTYDVHEARIGFYEDGSGVHLIYFINLNGSLMNAVDFISIHLIGRRKVLTLCEVEAYGECPSGKWSLQCSKQCPTSCPNDCNRDTGKCNTVCIGYSNPPKCDTVCASGKWGINCRNTCNNGCFGAKCDVKTGLCDKGCNGYSDPPYCGYECVKGTYGRNCSFNCSSLCVNGECDPVKGDCDKCPLGYEGHACDIKTFSVDLNSFGIGYAVGTGVLVLVIMVLLLNKTLVFHWSPRTESFAVRTNLQLEEFSNYDHVHQPDDVDNDYETPSTNKCYEDALAKSHYDYMNVT